MKSGHAENPQPAGADANAASTSPVAGSRSGSGPGWAALALSVLALGAAGYAWYQTAVNARLAGGEQNNRLQIMEQQLDEVTTSQASVDGIVEQVRQRMVDSEAGVAEQVSQVRQLVGSTEAAILGQLSEVRQQVASGENQVSAQLETLRTQAGEYRKALENRMTETAGSLEARNEAFRQEFDTLAASIGELQAELGTSVAQWSLREVEHLLVIANQRALLGRDTANARRALQLADQRLEQLEEPAFLPVREELSREIAALGEVKPVDYAGVTNTLSLLSSTLEDLPMRGITTISGPEPATGGESAAAAGDQSAGDNIIGFGKSLLADLGTMVQVEKDGEPVIPPLSPEIRQMIIERGKLILEGAQVALMREQPEIFQDRLNAAEQWIRERFVEDEGLTVRWLEQLAGLKEVNPNTEIPDVSGSLNVLRKQMSGGA